MLLCPHCKTRITAKSLENFSCEHCGKSFKIDLSDVSQEDKKEIDKLERRTAIKTLRVKGYSFGAIGKAIGLSRQRVHQIFNNDNQNKKIGQRDKNALKFMDEENKKLFLLSRGYKKEIIKQYEKNKIPKTINRS